MLLPHSIRESNGRLALSHSLSRLFLLIVLRLVGSLLKLLNHTRGTRYHSITINQIQDSFLLNLTLCLPSGLTELLTQEGENHVTFPAIGTEIKMGARHRLEGVEEIEVELEVVGLHPGGGGEG